MDGTRVGRLLRVLRQRGGLTQEQLARKSGGGRWKIVRLEAGHMDELRMGDVERCFVALDGRLDIRAWYHGAAGDRLLDERHATLVGQSVQVLREYGWITRVEVSFSEYGERGRSTSWAGTRSRPRLSLKKSSPSWGRSRARSGRST